MPIVIDHETYLDMREAMRYLKVSRQTLNNYVEQGRLTKYRRGIRQIFFKQSDLDEFLRIRPDTD